MRVATIVFAYDRPYHLKHVLDGLSQSTIMPENLMIIQDGIKDTTDLAGWNEVNKLINDFDYCPNTEVVVKKQNKGLATSIIDGVNRAFENSDAVIVLEDDCVPAKEFLRFMTLCLSYYVNNNRIYSVGGYAWPIDVKPHGNSSLYFSGRLSTWGWGTWKDRWRLFSQDLTMYRRLCSTSEGSRKVAMWSNCSRETAMRNAAGDADSWGHYWGLKIIENDGVCISPYKSLINNIGNDGSGVHSGVSNKYDVEIDNTVCGDFVLPEEIEIYPEVIKGFSDLYGGYTALNSINENDGIIVYGMGGLFFDNERDICDKYSIVGFVDQNRRGYYGGRAIIRLSELKYKDDWRKRTFLVMIQDPNECFSICSALIKDYGIDYRHVIPGCRVYGKYVKTINDVCFDKEGNCFLIDIHGKEFKNPKFEMKMEIV